MGRLRRLSAADAPLLVGVGRVLLPATALAAATLLAAGVGAAAPPDSARALDSRADAPPAPGGPARALPRRVDVAGAAQTVTAGAGTLRLLYAVASDGQPESLTVSGGMVYAAEASEPDALVAWPIAAPALARSYVLGAPGASNSAPLVSPDGTLLVTAQHGATVSGLALTFTVSELPSLGVVCSRTVAGRATAEGFGGWTEHDGRLTAWYRTGGSLYGLGVPDCALRHQVALGAGDGPPDFVTPTIAPDGTIWASYALDGADPGGAPQARMGTARFGLEGGTAVRLQCAAPVGHGLHGYGTPVVVPGQAGEAGEAPDSHDYAVVVASNDGTVSRLAPDCTVTWSRRVLRPADGTASGVIHQGLASSAPLGLLFLGDNSAWDGRLGPDAGSVIALDAATGAEVWRWNDRTRPQAFAPFVVGDYVFVRSYGHGALPPRLTLLDAATGRQIDSIDLAPPSEPRAGSGPISAKLLCTSSVCIAAAAGGTTSAPGWWFVVAFNDLPHGDEAVPYSGDRWHQNATRVPPEAAGYSASGGRARAAPQAAEIVQ